MANRRMRDFAQWPRVRARCAGVVRMRDKRDLLCVPHTIVYLEGVPYSWYFTSHADGKYKRRSKKKLVSEEIYNHFRKQWRNRRRASSNCARPGEAPAAAPELPEAAEAGAEAPAAEVTGGEVEAEAVQ